VRYEIHGALSAVLNCHCSVCRKAHGSAFRSRGRVAAKDFKWIAGEDLMTYFESSPGTRRGFCRVCGSPILTRFDKDPSMFSVPFGAFDDDPGVSPQLHAYVASKAPWHEIADDLPQFDERPPGV
jgi:hypothetical protein